MTVGMCILHQCLYNARAMEPRSVYIHTLMVPALLVVQLEPEQVGLWTLETVGTVTDPYVDDFAALIAFIEFVISVAVNVLLAEVAALARADEATAVN